MKTEFPLYRKYPNSKSYFKVMDKDHFEEIQMIGNYYDVIVIKAKILPEFNLVKDIIENAGGRWIEISEEEYEEFLLNCKNNKRFLHEKPEL